MKLILSTHNVKHTAAVEEHVRERIAKLEHLDHEAIEARVNLEREETHGPHEREYKAGMRICVSGPDYFAEDWEEDLFKAIDLATKKLEQQIRKRHNKEKAKSHSEAAREKERRNEQEV